MIGKLKGIVDTIEDDHAIVDVGGVGYVVFCSTSTLQRLPRGEAVALAIETQVREDAIRLYGFLGRDERDWFRLLQNVQGVGAKVALALLGTLAPADLAQALALQDKAAVARTPGVGPKLAARLVAELKDKAPAFASGLDPAAARLAGDEGERSLPRPVQDAISALINLGYSRPQAATAVASALQALGEAAEAGALIRRGLRELATG